MPSSSKIYLLCVFLLALSCHNKNHKRDSLRNANEGIKSKEISQPSQKSFLDSVLAGDELTLNQMRAHTSILIKDDDFPKKPVFTGDTVYFKNTARPIAIVGCSDQLTCTRFFMFVFSGDKSTDLKLVKTDCDEEEDVSSWRMDYRIINDSLFNVRDVNVKNSEDENDTIKVVNHFFKINGKGKIVAVK